ncbi:MAG: winged helix-turn-helix transcriptional regulator [Methanomethylovorans sp.]|jgi:predicted transcriptional regulator|nr:winged helix-turn-helix transcriptional regulator [Methanomethylovorans sp.]
MNQQAQHIILISLEKPKDKNLESDIRWLCDSFGLSSGRDTENMATRIIMNMLSMLAEDDRVTSESIADNLDVRLSRVNHHLRNLIDSGIIYRKKRLLYLRGGSLKAAVQEMRKDSERIFDELEAMAEEIDKKMGLKNR